MNSPSQEPPTQNVHRFEDAVIYLCRARDLMTAAKAPKAAAAIRRALKSTEGAQRHAARIASQPATIARP